MDRLVRAAVAARLREAGCVAADDEAAELLDAAGGDPHAIAELVRRRCAGEPLAWITGRTRFCGLEVRVDTGVYVPRWQSEVVASAAIAALPPQGVAIDLCCGTGAVAMALQHNRRRARIVAVDADSAAVTCARSNGVDALEGDLFRPVPLDLAGAVDVVVAVAPYVPTNELPRLASTPEPRAALDGGPDGLDVIRRIAVESPRWLRPGGALVVEIGGPQIEATRGVVRAAGYQSFEVLRDLEGDVCGAVAGTRIAT